MTYKELKNQLHEKVEEFERLNNKIYHLDYSNYRKFKYSFVSDGKKATYAKIGLLITVDIIIGFRINWLMAICCAIVLPTFYYLACQIEHVVQKDKRGRGEEADFTIYCYTKAWLKDVDQQLAALKQDLAVAQARVEEKMAKKTQEWNQRRAKQVTEAAKVYSQIDKLLHTIVEKYHGKVSPHEESSLDVTITLLLINYNTMTFKKCQFDLPINQEGLQMLASYIAIMHDVMERYNALLESENIIF